MDGAKCTIGMDSALMEGTSGGPGMALSDHCEMAPTYVSVYLAFNIGYNILLILILKYGSANILWMAMTIMVPLTNVAFSLHFIPGHKPLKSTDIAGLLIIMSGLLLYRFAGKIIDWFLQRGKEMSPLGTVGVVDSDHAAKAIDLQLFTTQIDSGTVNRRVPNIAADTFSSAGGSARARDSLTGPPRASLPSMSIVCLTAHEWRPPLAICHAGNPT